MLTNALPWLRSAGVTVEVIDRGERRESSSRPDAVLAVSVEDTEFRFTVEVKTRAPYPSELDRLGKNRAALARLGQPLMLVPFVAEALGSALTEAGWSWADDHGNFDLRAPGLLLSQRRTTKAPERTRANMPQGSGGLAVIRALLRPGEGLEAGIGPTKLAESVGVSQPRASQVLRQLHDRQLVEKVSNHTWRPNREALLDTFLADYAGPGGSQQYLYSLDSPLEAALHVARQQGLRDRVVVSADIGSDLLLPWRRPEMLILYFRQAGDPAALGLVEAQGAHDANVVIRSPRDQSVFAVPPLKVAVGNVTVPVADPVQLIWDLEDLGGADRLEAAGRMREWLLAHP